MKACKQTKCLYYEPTSFGNCNDKKLFAVCDAKNYQNKVITQKQMNEIIDKIAGWYPEDIFKNPTLKETDKLSKKQGHIWDVYLRVWQD